jgi:hypothetical protein
MCVLFFLSTRNYFGELYRMFQCKTCFKLAYFTIFVYKLCRLRECCVVMKLIVPAISLRHCVVVTLQVLVNTTVSLRVHLKGGGDFLTSWATVSSSRSTLLHGIMSTNAVEFCAVCFQLSPSGIVQSSRSGHRAAAPRGPGNSLAAKWQPALCW